jgi:hypothetical protein
MVVLRTNDTGREIGGGRRIYMVRSRDNPDVELADLFETHVSINGRQWRVLDVSFRDGLGDSGSPSEVGLTVAAI